MVTVLFTLFNKSEVELVLVSSIAIYIGLYVSVLSVCLVTVGIHNHANIVVLIVISVVELWWTLRHAQWLQ